MNTSATGRLRDEPDAGPKSPVAAVLRCAFCLSAIPVAYGITLEIERLDRSPHLFILLVGISLCAAYAGPRARWMGSMLSVVSAVYLLEPITRMPELTLLLLFTGAVLVLNFTVLNYKSLERDMAYERDELACRLDVRTAELEQTNERLKVEMRRRASAEEELRTAREELARKVGAMSGAELAAAVAHEINQPITGLITQCAAATNWLDRNPPDVEEARNSVAAATGCAERAAEVVHRVRRLMAGEPIGTDLVDVNAVVRSAVGLSSHVTALGRENVRCNLFEHLPRVRGDRTELELVMLNLLANAVEAMESSSGDRNRLEVRSYLEGTDVCLAVADTGPGIPAGAEMFRPFYSTKATGLGVGLSICRSIVLAHRGTIACKNGESRGAVFEVRIPAGVCGDECDPTDRIRDRRRGGS